MITQELMEAAVQERLREAAELRRQHDALAQLRDRRAAQAPNGRPPWRRQWLRFMAPFARVFREKPEAAAPIVDFRASHPSS